MKGFCEKKFSSMLISGTFTKAVMYLMLLSDSIIAGYFIGESGVAGINAITPVTAFGLMCLFVRFFKKEKLFDYTLMHLD